MNRLVPLILAVALFMEHIDSTVISTALPAIAGDLDTNPIALKLALTSYFVALAVFIPVSGWMADRYGAKRVFMAAIGVFMVGSVACAVAGSLGEFVVARFLQGAGGAMMTPIARLVLVRATKRSELVDAMAWLTIPALVGPLIGPPLGGFVTTYASWHWIFLLNIPVGIAGIAATRLFLPEIPRGPAQPLDFTGFVLCGTAAAGVLFGLSVVSLPALPPAVGLATTALGVVAGLAYIRHDKRVAAPLLPLALFSNPVFRTTVIGGSIFRVGIGATPFLLPLMLQLGFGLTPFQSGMITFVGALGAIAMKFAASRVYRQFGFRRVMAAMGLLSAIFVAGLAAFGPGVSFVILYVLLLANGFTRSLFFTGLNALAFSEIPDTDAGHATAMSAVAQHLSIALGVAVAGAILEMSTYLSRAPLGVGDFQLAFGIVAVITVFAVLPFLALRADAGSAASGHRMEAK